MDESQQLAQAMAGLEAQRALLGDQIVEPLLAAAREKLQALEAMMHGAGAERKLVTVLFADVSGFTAIAETMDAEDLSETMNALWQRLDRTIVAHGGLIDKHIGDAVMALWGARQAREDDPTQAILAALAMQAALAAFREEQGVALAMRIGINTGPVLLGTIGTTAEFTAMGDAVNLASRLEQAAPVGSVLISHPTFQHVQSLFELQPLDPITVKGKRDPLQVYLVHQPSAQPFSPAIPGIEGIESAFIGRQAELQLLHQALQQVVTERRLVARTLLGEAGVGKSRLLWEFQQPRPASQAQVQWFHGRATQEMTRLPYALLRNVLAARFGIQDGDPAAVARTALEAGVVALLDGAPDALMKAHILGHLIGLDFSASPYLAGILDDGRQIRDRASVYLFQLMQALSAQGPVVLCLEDLHWADEASLDSLETLMAQGQGLPLLLLALARPTLLERRPTWAQAAPDHLPLRLAPLSEEENRQQVHALLQRLPSLPDALCELIVRGAEGNPFYTEELIKMLIERGVIVPGRDQWQLEPQHLDTLQVPTTLTGVLQARLDGLSAPERETLQCAAVIGRTFWDQAVVALWGEHPPTPPVSRLAGHPPPSGAAWVALRATLNTLRQRELVQPSERPSFGSAREYFFRHALLREVTYERILKRQRRRYHARAAAWLIEFSGERVEEYSALIAEHYERAGEEGAAAHWYARAGAQAQASYAPASAIEAYEKALTWVTGPERGALLRQMGTMLELVGRWPEAEQRYQEAHELARTGGDALSLAHSQQALGRLCQKRGEIARALAWLAQAHASWQALGETSEAQIGQMESLADLGTVWYHQGDYSQARQALEASLSLATALGHQRGLATALNRLGGVAYNQGDYPSASEAFQQSLAIRRALGDKEGIAISLGSLGNVARSQGDYPAARQFFEESLSLRREIGDQRGMVYSLGYLGNVARALGEHQRAQAYYEEGLAISRALGDKSNIALLLGTLGGLAVELGDLGRARTLHEASLALERELGNQRGIAFALCHLGQVALAEGQLSLARACYGESLHRGHDLGNKWVVAGSLIGLAGVAAQRPSGASRAVRLVAAAEALLTRIGAVMGAELRLPADRALAQASTYLTPLDVEAARQVGASETLEAVLREADDERQHPDVNEISTSSVSGLLAASPPPPGGRTPDAWQG
jgi:class 3 adenylate cyclase/tetratricopeptide (TPR) repeat protein